MIAGALIAALSVPLAPGGAGWLVAAIAGVAALTIARPPAEPVSLVRWQRPGLDRSRFAWGAATIALLAVSTVRAAGWLVLLCLAPAFLTGILAVAGGRTTKGILLTVWAAPAAAFRSVPWLKSGARGPGSGGVRIAATVGVSLALLIVFGTLFASADAAFAGVVDAVIPDLDVATALRWILLFTVGLLVLGGAAYLRAAPPDLSGLDSQHRRRVARLEWSIPLSLLVLLFAVFVGIQLTVLFGDSQHVLTTEGLTYAEYARTGFWQLLLVTGLTLLVLAGAARWAPRDTRTDRVLIRSVLGTLAVLTLVIVGSALHRMDLYADTYGLTRLRLLVPLCEAWLGVVFLMILMAGIRLRTAWLPRAVVAAGVLALLGLAAANPDRLIAERNIVRAHDVGSIDIAFLSTLSVDAVPALDKLPPADRNCALRLMAAQLGERDGDWRTWSWSREEARKILDAHPVADGRNCPLLVRS
ncbi:DUF4153 domain-containing protein [Actinoplanes sp. TFC3]|uniref:DUF4153 domain-containing protein n=1 Tax=Actinoplanes sp. TFC3 TaxID=1710355 RepID=UPI001F280F3B|nr:DUF4173 domain-containing protein [Actinoplanes sp. TFC3]